MANENETNATVYGNQASPVSLWTAFVAKKGDVCDCCSRRLKVRAGTVRVSLETGRYVRGETTDAVQIRGVGPECVAKYGSELELAHV